MALELAAVALESAGVALELAGVVLELAGVSLELAAALGLALELAGVFENQKIFGFIANKIFNIYDYCILLIVVF